MLLGSRGRSGAAARLNTVRGMLRLTVRGIVAHNNLSPTTSTHHGLPAGHTSSRGYKNYPRVAAAAGASVAVQPGPASSQWRLALTLAAAATVATTACVSASNKSVEQEKTSDGASLSAVDVQWLVSSLKEAVGEDNVTTDNSE